MRIRELDWTSDADVAAYAALVNEREAELGPAAPPLTVDAARETLRPRPETVRAQRWLGERDGDIVGYAEAQEWLLGEDEAAVADVVVSMRHRGHGVGTALLARAEDWLSPSRTRIRGSIGAGQDEEGSAGEEFAARHGFRPYSRSSHLSLPLPVDAGRLNALPSVVSAGVRLETHVDRVPLGQLPAYCELVGYVDSDQPNGTEVVDPVVLDPDDVARWTEEALARGERFLTTLAWRGDDLVALTEIALPAEPARPARQTGTCVARGHRGSGLGMAVKIQNLRALHAEPGMLRASLEAGAADDNAAMLAINRALGYRVTQRWVHVVKVRA